MTTKTITRPLSHGLPDLAPRAEVPVNWLAPLSTRIKAEVLRHGADDRWPEAPEQVGADGTLSLASIAFACPLRAVYAQTHLA